MSDSVAGLVIREPLEGDVPSGIYIASSHHTAYGWLEAIARDGPGSFLGERYIGDAKYIAVAIPGPESELSPNVAGAIRVGREFFTTALRDYSDWKEKWWREAIQNSVDAGATSITCIVERSMVSDDEQRVICADNGGGMDRETLIDKFLVLGGTTKTSGNTRGGFGKAKELLLLPWIRWSVHTQDTYVEGEGIEYEVHDATEYLAGTRVEVYMPADNATHPAAAQAFIGKCNLPGVRFSVNGEFIAADLKSGQLKREFSGAELYYNPKSEFHQQLLVRVQGLFMFDMWIPSGVEGQLIVELTRPSVEILTANRDGFRDRTLRREVETFVNELAADLKSALRSKQGLMRKKFEGEGKFSLRRRDELRADMLDVLGDVAPEATKRGELLLSDEQLEALSGVVEERGAGDLGEAEQYRTFNMRASGELAEVMLKGTAMGGADHVEAAIAQLSWEPDFFLVNEVEGFKVPSKFYPEKMAPNIRKLARLWAELCRFVLLQLGSRESFGVGYIFEEGIQATFVHEDNENWLLLNPYRDPRDITGSRAMQAELLSYTSRDDLNLLYALAIHECTHMADGITYHDESFASAMTRNVAKTANKDKQVRAIKKIVIGAEREQRERRGAAIPRALAATPIYQVVDPAELGGRPERRTEEGTLNAPSGLPAAIYDYQTEEGKPVTVLEVWRERDRTLYGFPTYETEPMTLEEVWNKIENDGLDSAFVWAQHAARDSRLPYGPQGTPMPIVLVRRHWGY